MKNLTFLTNKMKWLFVPLVLLTLGVGNAWGDTQQTYTLNSSHNNTTQTTGAVTWNIASGAIGTNDKGTLTKLTGTITVTLPSNAQLNSVTVNKGSNWGGSARVQFKSGSTTLNTFSTNGTYSLTSNKTDLTYTFSYSGRGNAWVSSIQVSYVIASPQTVNWSVNGENWNTGHGTPSTSVVSGSKVSALPTTPTSSDCDKSKVFVGWSASPIVGTTNTAPTDLFTTVAGSPTITGTTTFYAVFASGGTSATRVTTTGGFTSGDRIVIGNDKNSYIMLSTFATTTNLPTESSSSITVSNANQQWLVKGDNTNGYLLTSGTVVAGSTGSSSGSSISNTTDRSLWTFTTTSVNSNCLAATNKSSGYRLEYSGGWVHYNSTNAGWTSLKVYKVNYSAYATSCCTPLGTINGSFLRTIFHRIYAFL